MSTITGETSPLRATLLELIRRTSSDLPPDVVAALDRGQSQEQAGSSAAGALETIACNIGAARVGSAPLCQDTGMLKFYVHCPVGFDQIAFREAAEWATAEATARGFLRQNSVDSLTGRNTGNNLGSGTPMFHFQQWRRGELDVRLIQKGGGCENVGAQYSLPRSFDEFGGVTAGRDLAGARLAILHAVWAAQGKGCAPGYIGVCIGGDRAGGLEVAKEQLLRVVGDHSLLPELDRLEHEVAAVCNGLGIGPMGFGGKTTVLGVKIAARNRLPASFFVSVAYGCWAHRRRGCVLEPDGRVTRWLYEREHEEVVA
jgi:fumarate hydratase class I